MRLAVSVVLACALLAGCSGHSASATSRAAAPSRTKVGTTTSNSPPASASPSGNASPSTDDTGNAVTCPAASSTPGTTVHTAADLTAALSTARPGTEIRLADGTYSGHFVAAAPGEPGRPIWVCGGANAVIDGGDIKSGYAFHLNQAANWFLVGFTVRGGQKGIVADHSSGCILQDLTVSGTGDEAIHLRSSTSRCVIRNNRVSHTGLHTAKFGEGIYIGSAVKNWPTYGDNGGPDRSDGNLVIGNHISATTAENVDIKEGTSGGRLIGNTFDGNAGLTAADSWVDVKGNNWLIAENRGTRSPVDGFQVHRILDGWGQGNVFRDNDGQLDGSGYGIHLAGAPDNTVACTNTFTGAGLGQSSAPCL